MFNKKNTGNIINYTISILIFVFITLMIAKQLKHQNQLQDACNHLLNNWTTTRKFTLLCVIILMLCNWSVEAIKWKLLLKPLQYISYSRSLRSVFTGISISLLTPNRIGEYAGRIIYLKNINKLKGITANIVSSFAQFIAASIFGIAGCIYYLISFHTEWYLPYVLIGSIIVLCILLLLYFKLNYFVLWLERFTILNKVAEYMAVVKTYQTKILLQLIFLSAFRYIIFAMQYYFLLQAFDISILFIPAMLSIFLIFWLMAIIPSIAIAEIPIRTEVSYRILQVFSNNVIGIMSSSILLWFINLIIPALIGGLVLIGAKFNSNDDE